MRPVCMVSFQLKGKMSVMQMMTWLLSALSVGIKETMGVTLVVLEVKGAPMLKLSLRVGVSAASSMRWRKLMPRLFRGCSRHGVPLSLMYDNFQRSTACHCPLLRFW